jgi:hypothetical protein
MNKNLVVILRVIAAVLLLLIGLKILPIVTKIFADFKATPWVVISLLLFLLCALVAPILTIVSAVRVDHPSGVIWAWSAFGIGLFASVLPFLGNYVQAHVWMIDELRVDFGLLATDPRIFQYLFIVRDVGLVVLLVSILIPAGRTRFKEIAKNI